MLKFVLLEKFNLLELYFQNRIPFFTLPFTLPTMVFINVNDTRGLLHRVENFSYPEKQAWEWHKAQKVKFTQSKAIYLNLVQNHRRKKGQIYQIQIFCYIHNAKTQIWWKF